MIDLGYFNSFLDVAATNIDPFLVKSPSYTLYKHIYKSSYTSFSSLLISHLSIILTIFLHRQFSVTDNNNNNNNRVIFSFDPPDVQHGLSSSPSSYITVWWYTASQA